MNMTIMEKVRTLLETIRRIAIHLTHEEMSDIAKILAKAIERLEKEQH